MHNECLRSVCEEIHSHTHSISFMCETNKQQSYFTDRLFLVDRVVLLDCTKMFFQRSIIFLHLFLD